jgi:uncharacterized membrane protein
VSVASQPSAEPHVRFEWIGEAWRCYAAAPGVWIASLTVAGLINAAVVVACFFAFGFWLPVKAAFEAEMQAVASGNTTAISSTASTLTSFNALPGSWAMMLVCMAVAAYIYAGLQTMANIQLRGRKIVWSMMFSGGPVFGQYLLYTLIASIPEFIEKPFSTTGTIEFIVDIVNIVVYVLAASGYAMVADGAPAIEALRRSIGATSPNLIMGIVFYLAFSVVLAVSAIPCLLGLTVTTPMITIIFSLAYRDLIGMRSADQTASA